MSEAGSSRKAPAILLALDEPCAAYPRAANAVAVCLDRQATVPFACSLAQSGCANVTFGGHVRVRATLWPWPALLENAHDVGCGRLVGHHPTFGLAVAGRAGVGLIKWDVFSLPTWLSNRSHHEMEHEDRILTKTHEIVDPSDGRSFRDGRSVPFLCGALE
jgi:hypothetical protein